MVEDLTKPSPEDLFTPICAENAGTKETGRNIQATKKPRKHLINEAPNPRVGVTPEITDNNPPKIYSSARVKNSSNPPTPEPTTREISRQNLHQ